MLTARVVGAESVRANLVFVPDKARMAVRNCIQRLALTLLTLVKENKLFGQVLRNPTGTLRRSINQRLDETGNSITGAVGTNLVYAAAHEFGCTDVVQVKAHLRTITQAWGRELKAPVTFLMPSHSMRMNLPERSFLRTALEEMKPEIAAQLAEAIRRAL